MYNEISVSKKLTSSNFYNYLLKNVMFMKRYHTSENPIVLDFSETQKIEPLVIPNLLCLGKLIMGESGTKMVIRIPETIEGGKLRFYMDQVGFARLADNKIFEYESSPYNGMEGKPIDPLCGSLYFSEKLTRNEIINAINGFVTPFSEQYLQNYLEYSEDDDDYINKVDHFLYEIVDNCRIHGESGAFLTIHARYSDRQIYISISDLGKGFFESWNNRVKSDSDKKTEELLLQGNSPTNEFEAILCGVYKRIHSKVYGLYNITRQTLELNGKVRIHSNNTQVVFTPKILSPLLSNSLLRHDDFLRWNKNEQLEFEGVHIEMEIPF